MSIYKHDDPMLPTTEPQFTEHNNVDREEWKVHVRP